MSHGFDLDFARTQPPRPWAAWLLLAVGLAAALWAGSAWLAAGAEHQGQVQRLETLRQARPAAILTTRPAKKDAAAQTVALRQLDLPWGGLLASLESTRPDGIALLSLEADARHGQLSLTAEAKDYAAMIDYYRRLQATPGLRDATLTQHGIREDGQAQPVRFTLRARWAGEAAP